MWGHPGGAGGDGQAALGTGVGTASHPGDTKGQPPRGTPGGGDQTHTPPPRDKHQGCDARVRGNSRPPGTTGRMDSWTDSRTTTGPTTRATGGQLDDHWTDSQTNSRTTTELTAGVTSSQLDYHWTNKQTNSQTTTGPTARVTGGQLDSQTTTRPTTGATGSQLDDHRTDRRTNSRTTTGPTTRATSSQLDYH